MTFATQTCRAASSRPGASWRPLTSLNTRITSVTWLASTSTQRQRDGEHPRPAGLAGEPVRVHDGERDEQQDAGRDHDEALHARRARSAGTRTARARPPAPRRPASGTRVRRCDSRAASPAPCAGVYGRSDSMGVRRAAWAINPACAWGPLAQLVERHVYTVDVVGSSPAGPTPALGPSGPLRR